jgi:hypothetical protein
MYIFPSNNNSNITTILWLCGNRQIGSQRLSVFREGGREGGNDEGDEEAADEDKEMNERPGEGDYFTRVQPLLYDFA